MTKVSANILTGAVASSFSVMWFLQLSLAMLWGLINFIQMIVVLPLVQVIYPSNALTLNSALLTLANFEILPCEKIDRKCISEFGKKEFDKNFYDYKRIHDNLPNDKKEKFYPYHFGGLILVKDENNFMDCTTKSEVDENDPCSKGYLPFPKYHTTYFGSKISNTKNPLFSKYDNPIV